MERNGEKSLGRKNQRGIVERKGQDLSFPQASLWEWWNNPRVKGNICKVIHVFHRKVWINRGLGCEKHKFFRGIWRKSKRKGAGEARMWWKYVVLWLKSYPQFPQVGVENCGMSVWRCGELTGRSCGEVESAGFSTGEGMNSLGGNGAALGKRKAHHGRQSCHLAGMCEELKENRTERSVWALRPSMVMGSTGYIRPREGMALRSSSATEPFIS